MMVVMVSVEAITVMIEAAHFAGPLIDGKFRAGKSSRIFFRLRGCLSQDYVAAVLKGPAAQNTNRG